MKKIQIIRGFNDILPQESAKWQYLENIVRKTLSKYNYDEVRLPILEKSELFHRSVGESSDIVSKETYDLNDRNGDSLTLRPEGTASCVRMVVENNLVSRGQTQKLWYLGPMFRYERPQKGRYRQFYQLGVEAYGYSGLSIDFDMISVSWSLFSCLGLSEYVTLELNNLGSAENRKQYSEALLNYLKPYHNALDADSIKRLDKNPLRILDSKVETTQNIIANAPKLINFIDNNLREEFDLTCKYLDHLGVKYNVNKNLVRGLDYYSGLVFEWTTDRLGAQSAVCAGGRYDSLVATLGGGDNFAIGFAVGMERLVLLIDDLNLFPSLEKKVDIFFVLDNGDIAKSMSLVNNIRNSIADLNFDLDFKYGSLKSQFKKADKSNADLAIIIGENELQNDTVTVKFLKTRDEQQTINRNELSDFLKENIIKK